MKTRNKALIITGIIIIFCSIIMFFIGGWLAGWNFIEFFKSNTFIWMCILLGVYAIAVITFIIKDAIDKKL